MCGPSRSEIMDHVDRLYASATAASRKEIKQKSTLTESIDSVKSKAKI